MRKIIMTMLVAFGFVLAATAQNRTISGTLQDEKGNPVANGSVMLKGTTNGTTSDASGKFSLSVPNTAKTLVVSGIGFSTQDVAIGSKTNLDITIKSSNIEMEDVIVTGYTTEKKRQFAGSATTLTSKAVENVPVASFDQMLQGRVPGLLANSGSGQPGAPANVRIRGTSSLGGQVQPLYIVDGVPLSPADLAAMNPNDFETVTVLKDANAAAMYGSRGSLGVIVVTTKRGKAGQTNFSFKSQFGFTQRPQPSQFNQLDSRGMLAYEEFVGGFANGLTAPGWAWSAKNPANASLPATSPANNPFGASRARFDFLLDSLRNNNVDYYGLLFRTGIARTNELSMSGGNSSSRYLISLNNFSQEGTDRKSKLDRYSLRLNLDNNIGKLTTQLSSLISYSKTIFNEGSFNGGNGPNNPFAMVWRAKPYENPYRPDGTIIFGTSTPTVPRQMGNLIERSDASDWTENQIKANAGLNIAYKILPSLTFRNNVGVDASSFDAQGAIAANSFVGSLQTFQSGFLNESFLNRLQLINTSSLVFNKKFGTKHDLEAGAFFETIRQWNRGFGLSIFNLDPRLTQTSQGAGPLPTNGAVTVNQNGGSAKSGFGIRSAFTTLRYTFDNKYTVAANFRRDGTSRIINPDNKEIDTYSASVAWDATKENFFEKQKVLSDFRARFSFGESANVNSIPGGSFGINSSFYNVANYTAAQQAAYATVGFAGSPITATAPSGAVNRDLRLETVEKLNLGFDLGFVKNRIRLTVDLYKNTTKDLFVRQQLPATSGFGGALNVNAGNMENKGVELDLTLDVIKSKDIDFTLNANHGYNKNEITSLGTVTEYPEGTGIVKKGLPVGSHLSFAYLGADVATGRPIYKRTDGTPTTNINEAGQFHEFGTWLPVHTGGFNASFRFKRITIDALFSYQFDVRRYNNVQNWVSQGDLTFAGAVTQSQVLLTDQWRRPGDNKMLQAPNASRQFTSYDISDASFLRFRNLNVSYMIPEIKAGGRTLIKSSRFYIQAQNIAIFSSWSGLDPEDNNNISLAEFPNPKAVVLGLDINF